MTNIGGGGGLNYNCTTKQVVLIQVKIHQLYSYVPFLLRHAPVNGDGWEGLFHQQLGEGYASLHRLDEDDHLKRKRCSMID